MKVYLLLGVFLLYSCKNLTKSNLEEIKTDTKEDEGGLNSLSNDFYKYSPPTDTITFDDDTLGTILLKGLSIDNFSVEKKGDTIFVVKKNYEGLENAKIEFEGKNSKGVLKGQISYGVSQNTLDDISGSNYLNFVTIDTISVIRDKKYQFPIGKHIYSYPKLVSMFQSAYFKEIRNESYDYQLDFFKEVLKKESSTYKCCPEYKKQAQEFLKKRKSDFKTMEDLSIAPSYTKVALELGNNTWLIFYNY